MMSKLNFWNKGKNQTAFTSQPSALLTNPIINNASSMNNEFLNHGKVWNSQGTFQPALQQPITHQPVLFQTPLLGTTSGFAQGGLLSNGLSQQGFGTQFYGAQNPYWQSRGYQRGQYRTLRLRTKSWGTPSENGWSGFNNWRYQEQNLASWEPKNFILEELRTQARSQRGLGFAQQGFQQPIALTKTNPTFVQTVVRPTIYQETIRTDTLLQVQPILHREIEQPIVNHIQKHITEAPAPAMGGIVRMAPVLQETLNTRVITEVTPVLHRERAVRQFERVEEHLQEHVVAPTQHTKSVQFEATPIVAAPVAPVVLPVQAPLTPTLLAPINNAAIYQTLTKAPIVEETLRTDRLVEVVPVVHREIEQNVINHIEKHITEAPAPALGGTVRMAPIVEETLNTRVINEITPVVHRERAVRQLERVEEHLQEHIVAPAQHTQSVQYEATPIVAAPVAPVVLPVQAPLTPTVLAPINTPAIHQTLTKTAIVEETLRTYRVIEVVPVVHREIEQNVINHIEKHITEAPAPAMGGIVRMAPIVQETHNTHVLEEIQPVLHRERVQLQAERVEEHLVEHIVAPTQHTKTVLAESLVQQNLAAPVLAAPLTVLPAQAPLVNTTPITKVVPSSNILLEKKIDQTLLQQQTPSYGSAMM